MAVVYLNSHTDQRLLPYQKLAERANRKANERFIVEGRFLVERLLASPFKTESIVTDATRLATLPTTWTDQAPIYVLPRSEIDQLVGFDFHRGMLACGRRVSLPEFDKLVPAASAEALLVICCRVVDPTNMGAIMRNCAAFGADAVLLGPGCADPFSRRVLRVSMGATLSLGIAISNCLDDDLTQLTTQHGVTLVASILNDKARPLAEIEKIARVGLVIGNEGWGLPDDVVAACQQHVTIPMASNVDSLNVAVASGIFLYHFRREL